MPDPTVGEIMDAMAAQIQDMLCGTADPVIELLQVEPRYVFNPTPPSIDIYPADPFTSPLSFDPGDREYNFVVRARVGTAENEGGQDLLLSMMDPRADESVAGAIESDDTLGTTCGSLSVDGPSGFGVFPVAGGDQNLLGCTWSVRVLP